MSRNPAVVTRAVRAPVRSITVLEVWVVAWTTSPIAAGSAPLRRSRRRTPSMAPDARSSLVVNTFSEASTAPAPFIRTASVNVPPISTQTESPPVLSTRSISLRRSPSPTSEIIPAGLRLKPTRHLTFRRACERRGNFLGAGRLPVAIEQARPRRASGPLGNFLGDGMVRPASPTASEGPRWSFPQHQERGGP